MEDLKKKEVEYKNKLLYTYKESKSLFIDAEELLDEMNFFPAPLIEHRDALDHIMRYMNKIEENGLTEDAIKELDSALGHEIRAYFDIADFISVTIRDEISKSLKGISKKQIIQVWQEYNSIQKQMIELSEDIALIRKNRTGTVENIKKYKKVLEEMFTMCKQFRKEIKPYLIKKGKYCGVFNL